MTSRRAFVGMMAGPVLVGLVGLLSVSALTAQAPQQAQPAMLAIGGDVATPVSISAAELASMPRTHVEAKDEGRTVVYEGVLAGELLKRAGAPLGGELRGKALTTCVLASASDGYQVLFSLAELDPALTGNDIIVADTIDGKPLPPHQGPFRVVAPKDARASRSIRMLKRLEVVRLEK